MTENFVAQIIADGRITIPDKIRMLMELKEGDFVRATIKKVNKNSKEA